MTFADKLKLVRKANNLTQAEFADSIGISRGNLSGLELGKVAPTSLLINCISLTYNIDKTWLTDDNNDDLSALNGDMIVESDGSSITLLAKDLNLDDYAIRALKAYEKLDEQNKKTIHQYIMFLASNKQDETS